MRDSPPNSNTIPHDFKLLAIRPLKGCSKKFRKVIEDSGEIYKFYNNYEFDKDSQDEVVKITCHKHLLSELYQIKGKLHPINVNIAAVVGKNGSGKSSLLEMFYAAIYLLGIESKALPQPANEGSTLEEYNQWLELRSEFKMEFYYQVDNSIYCLKFGREAGVEFKPIIFECPEADIQDKRDATISFLINSKNSLFNLSAFFYTIAINYSVYGLNSRHTGKWLDSLFHKNDGYQTPLVINPMRTEGNFDINKEENFAIYRLLSNLLKKGDGTENYEHRQLTKTQKAKRLRFTLNEQKVRYAFFSKDENIAVRFGGVRNLKEPQSPEFDYRHDELSMDILELVYKNLLDEPGPIERIIARYETLKYKSQVEKYIVQKLIKIGITYPEYFDTVSLKQPEISAQKGLNFYYADFKDLSAFINKLKADGTHVTFKLWQAVNYIKNNPLREEPENEIRWQTETVDKFMEDDWQKVTENFIELDITQLSERIVNSELDKIIEKIPPSVFKPKIWLEKTHGEKSELTEGSKPYDFNNLSSGEQQLIHSVQSIIYHINNVQSVFYQAPTEGNKRKTEYRFINILFDEVELYFHPDLQRQFISDLLKGLERAGIEKIEGINILFSTHSTFILSDILGVNVLKLNDGRSSLYNEKKQTLGANIHDLLADDFFLKTGFMGEYVKNKINSVIDFIQEREPGPDDWTPEKAEEFINYIGEPLIRTELHELFINEFYTDKQLDDEIERLRHIKAKRKKGDDSN